jgi:hypothetical protein
VGVVIAMAWYPGINSLLLEITYTFTRYKLKQLKAISLLSNTLATGVIPTLLHHPQIAPSKVKQLTSKLVEIHIHLYCVCVCEAHKKMIYETNVQTATKNNKEQHSPC